VRNGEEQKMIDELTDHESQLTDWERSFVDSVTEQLGRGVVLGPRQKTKLAEIYEQRVLGY
jgi:hypothetical protein